MPPTYKNLTKRNKKHNFKITFGFKLTILHLLRKTQSDLDLNCMTNFHQTELSDFKDIMCI